MTFWYNFTSKRPPNMDSYQTPNYAIIVMQNQMQVAEQPQPTFVIAFHQKIEIDPLDTEQTIATLEDVTLNAKTAARAIGWTLEAIIVADRILRGRTVSIETRGDQTSSRAGADLVKQKRPPKHNNPPAKPILAFDQVLADLETKLLQQYRLLQGTLTQIVKRDWITTLKFNLFIFIRVFDTIYKVIMTRALMDTTEQGNLLKTQPSPVIRPGFNNQMLRSLRALPQTEGARFASENTLLTRIVSFTGQLDQELKNLTTQQVIVMIRSKPEIMPPEWAQDLARKPIPETQLTAFLPLLSQLQQLSLNPYTPLNPFYNQLSQQQIQ
ncbi:MAG: hypothetical protein EZS28_005722 [Streblomastix strix]|uniref:Uncharacterized protein n=1 Tax=Streblomastix strix TaxID=222440 RepID=A0A5J4WWV8_9EUKA|nr:MAG: hypothetical protein EZS28_005722 [Streblomastix strix]